MRKILTAALAALTLAAASARADPVYFNHAVVVLDTDTWAALESTPFLKDRFAAANAHSTTGDGGAAHWSGFYLYGRSTYLELMRAGDADSVGKAAAGSTFLGMWIDRREALPAFVEPLSKALGAPVPIKTRSFRLGDQDIDWFQYTDLPESKAAPDGDDTWLMSPYADFLARAHPKEAPAAALADPLTRASNNLWKYDNKRLFRDVVAIRITAPEVETSRMAAELGAYGEKVSTRGRVTTVVTPECLIVLTSARPKEPRSVTFDIALNPGAHPKAPLRIGRSTLSFDRRTAHWRIPG
jgi:hypothetical protein